MNPNGNPIGRFGVRYIIRQRRLEGAINCPNLKNKIIGPHAFRHTIEMHFL